MRRSIHWSVQLWHALLLLVVVGAFGGTLAYRLGHERFQGIDTELKAQAAVISARIPPARRPPPRPDLRGGPHEGSHDDARFFPPGDEFAGRRGPRPEGGRSDDDGPPGEGPRHPGPRHGGGRGDRRPDFGPHGFDEPEGAMRLPPDVQRRYDDAQPGAPYFAIWRADGTLYKASGPLASKAPAPPRRAPFSAPLPPVFRQRGELREVIVSGPIGMQVLVGRSIHAEQLELAQLIRTIVVTGIAVTLVGLAGGWLLSRRAVQPIVAITSIAQDISATNLSRRIERTETASELGALAGVLNAMFDRLEQAFQRQVRFTADASHELRTPISVIQSHSELALSRERTAPEYRQTIDTCLRAARRMKSLTESLLVLARADAGKLDLQLGRFDLKDVIEECVQMVAPLATERRLTIRTELSRVEVCADRGKLAQLVTNLLSNAVRYNHEGGSVMLGLSAGDGYAILSVADTGVGIANEDQPRVFERFFRADKARSRDAGGNGLGLAICQSIVEAHGGAITFTSRIEQGTTFTVSLPATPALASAGSPPLTSDPAESSIPAPSSLSAPLGRG